MKKIIRNAVLATTAIGLVLAGAATPAHSTPPSPNKDWRAVQVHVPLGGTTVTQHQVNEFDFTFPCVRSGNPFHVVTTSDVTVNVTKPIWYPGGLRTVYAFVDTGTYLATSATGERRTGWFVDTYDAWAIHPTGAAPDAALRYHQGRRLILTSNPDHLGGTAPLFFEDDMTLDAAPYRAATDQPTEKITCRRW